MVSSKRRRFVRFPGALRGMRWSLKKGDELRRGLIALRTWAELRPAGFRTANRPFKLIADVPDMCRFS